MWGEKVSINMYNGEVNRLSNGVYMLEDHGLVSYIKIDRTQGCNIWGRFLITAIVHSNPSIPK